MLIMSERDKKERDPLENASRHFDVFANFWLGVVSAGARGFAVATSRTMHPRNEAHPRSLAESLIDRAAESLAVTTVEVASAAKTARSELKRLHSENGRRAEGDENQPSVPPASMPPTSMPPKPNHGDHGEDALAAELTG
jgi:hypothetical protein